MATANEVILNVMNEVQGLAKKDKNTAQGFSFRGIDAVLNVVGPALRKHGGFIVPNVLSRDYLTAQTAKGGTVNIARLTVEFAVHGTDGDAVKGIVAAEAFDSGDKATAKAMSVALRTFLLQTLALPTDEPDPDSFSYELGEHVPARDWVAEINNVKTIEAARQLYNEARQAKAPVNVIKAIETKASTLG